MCVKQQQQHWQLCFFCLKGNCIDPFSLAGWTILFICTQLLRHNSCEKGAVCLSHIAPYYKCGSKRWLTCRCSSFLLRINLCWCFKHEEALIFSSVSDTQKLSFIPPVSLASSVSSVFAGIHSLLLFILLMGFWRTCLNSCFYLVRGLSLAM